MNKVPFNGKNKLLKLRKLPLDTVCNFAALSPVKSVQWYVFVHTDVSVPQTRVFLLNWCAWFLRMKRPGEDRVRPACPNRGLRSSLTSMELNPNGSGPQSNTSNMLYVSVRGLDSNPHSTAATSPDSGVLCGRLLGRPVEEEMLLPTGQSYSVAGLEPELVKILEEVRFISKHFRDQDEEETVCNEWKFAACVIDRLCLMAFSLFTILCTIGILMSAPNFVEAISKDFFN